MAGDITYEEAVELFDILQGSGNYERWSAAASKWGADTGTEGILKWVDEHYGTTAYAEYYNKPTVAGEVFEPLKDTAGATKGYSVTWTGTPRTPSLIDSNYGYSVNPRTPVNTTATIVEERSVMDFKVGLREAGNFFRGSVVPAVAAAGIGITLGKTIDSTLYDANPDFWDSHGMSSLNPSTWNSITCDDPSLGATVFDLVFGIDNAGNVQPYINEDALSYLSWWLSTTGAFNENGLEATYDGSTAGFDNPDVTGVSLTRRWTEYRPNTGGSFTFEIIGQGYTYCYRTYNPIGQYTHTDFITVGLSGDTVVKRTNVNTGNIDYYPLDLEGETYEGTPFHYNTLSSGRDAVTGGTPINYPTIDPRQIGTIVFDGTVASTGIDGIGDQDGATTPTTTGWTDVPSTKQSLQQQYPQLWDGAKHQDYVDEDGTNKSITLIPINLPNMKDVTDIFPTSGERTQDEPLIDPTTATKDLIDTITKLITGIPTNNPPGTGSGDSPVVPVPVGSASSLWKIYNPTQAQVDAFGSWLWDSNFVEQIKRLFNDPMQAIIGIHKVFATPSIGGTATIKVGYLDSQVPSKWVDDQYTTINCGTVNLGEYFGNVFDYSPYTRVSLYLPFIGIVDLDVADVMRSSINVTYHVDVLSGACLADVKVTRDLASAVLYQYSGSAIVTYPVSSGTYLGVLAGIATVATGAVVGIMTGGVGSSALAVAGTATGLSHLHANVSHSGGFSGCAGAMAGKKPYLIISRPQTAMADNYGHFTGKPSNSHVVLKNCSGMTKVKSVYVGNINATDEEKDMIEAQLKAGVLV